MPTTGPGHDICTATPVGTFDPLKTLQIDDLLTRQTSCFVPEPPLAVFMQSALLAPSTASRSTRSRPSIVPGDNDPPPPGSRRTSSRNKTAPIPAVPPAPLGVKSVVETQAGSRTPPPPEKANFGEVDGNSASAPAAGSGDIASAPVASAWESAPSAASGAPATQHFRGPPDGNDPPGDDAGDDGPPDKPPGPSDYSQCLW